MSARAHFTWESSLESAGFRRDASLYRRDGLVARVEHGWLALWQPVPGDVDPLWGQLGRPGLWKRILRNPRRDMVLEFDLPLAVFEQVGADLDLDGQGDVQADPLRSSIEWAIAAAGGEAPDGWHAPPRERVLAWIEAGGLTVQSGPFVRQGSLVCEANRLSLRFTIAHQLPEQLSPARRRWLDEVLIDAQNRWRMVRIGLGESAGGPAVVAEVDLSGAPAPWVERLVAASAGGLRWVVSSLLWSCGFLADPGVECGAWEISLERVHGPQKRKENRDE